MPGVTEADVLAEPETEADDMAGTVDEAGGAAVELAALLTVIGTVVLV